MKINTLYSYFIIILFSPLLGKLIKNIIAYYKTYKNLAFNDKLYNLVSRLTPKEFEIWCSEYLSNIGFTNILLPSFNTDSERIIICKKDSEKFHVVCKKCAPDNYINNSTIEELLGSMISNNIHNGILLTTGSISEDTKTILNKINKTYNISIISYKELDISYNDYILKIN